MRSRVITIFWRGVDWLAGAKIIRKLVYAGIIVISVGVCLVAVWPDASFTPGWQPATTKIVKGGTDILLNGKMIGFLKGEYNLPQTIWVELTKKADYYEVARPVSGHGLLVIPLVSTAGGSILAAVLLAVFLARYRRRYHASE